MKLRKLADNKQIMKIRIGIFCLKRCCIIGFFIVVFFFSSGLYGQEKVHVVQRGETFYSIARTLGVKADDLMKVNGITDPSKLQAGQQLKIPGSSGQTSSGPAQAGRSATASYRVVRGDTLYSIARKFSVTVAAIQEANNLSSGYVLRVGDSLKLPAGAKSGQGAAAQVPQSRTETAPTGSNVLWPVAVRELSYMTGKLSGVVITGTRSEAVKSLTRGTVLSAGPYRGFGKVVIVQVEGSYLYVYGGCESLSVKEGDKVGPGTELGNLGVDVVSNKPQLFFMVYKSNVPVDPAKAPRA